MPLSTPEPRKHIHTREIVCHGYEREDGLWDIEGIIKDTKSYSFENRDRGTIEAGEPVHEMHLRLTVDDQLMIHKAEAALDNGPFNLCGDIAPDYSRLEGVRIGPGFRKKVHALVGGIKGCTHITHLLTGPLATTAYQTIMPILSRRRPEKSAFAEGEKPRLLGSCHAYAPTSDVVKRLWPEFHVQSKDS